MGAVDSSPSETPPTVSARRPTPWWRRSSEASCAGFADNTAVLHTSVFKWRCACQILLLTHHHRASSYRVTRKQTTFRLFAPLQCLL